MICFLNEDRPKKILIMDNNNVDILGEDAHDDYLMSLLDHADRYGSSEMDKFLLSESRKGRIELRDYNNFRYGEYTFISMLTGAGQKYVDDLEIVNHLDLTIFPKLIRVFKADQSSMLIVVKIPGNKGKDIAWGSCLADITESAMKETAKELRMLEDAGYFLLPRFRFSVGVTPDGHIMIPDFSLVKKADAQGILDDIYSRYEMFGYKKQSSQSSRASGSSFSFFVQKTK